MDFSSLDGGARKLAFFYAGWVHFKHELANDHKFFINKILARGFSSVETICYWSIYR